MANYVLEYIFGDLYTREGLDLKLKQMITITSLAVLGNAKPQLAYHINAALNGIVEQIENCLKFPFPQKLGLWACSVSC
jgi:4-carboxymuconolactone decarboxylase